jgi:glycosyltransferase involved in cell wall biosynthesis
MLRDRIYYALKPYVPWRLRMGIRKVLARRKRKIHAARWPINESAAAKPEGWPGWPNGKKFAFVLTHDVEGPSGLANCKKLLDLEKHLGFRSCFNFVPEGTYRVSAEFRDELEKSGFEVGVHDLEHNGKLFESKSGFYKKAARINRYLREWGAVGFRGGFMLRQLDWLHELEIAYDCSTFDTDPFEMQAGGTGTIFPFWIPSPRDAHGAESPPTRPDARDGYVELPYTLPQDSTLFNVFGESTPEIWLRKLDWIAAHGGMVLVNVHPDYLRFEGDPPSPRTFPVAHYIRLLEWLRECHGDTFWQPLPRDLAEFVRTISPRPAIRERKRVGMITHSFYEIDNRVTRYAEALTERGDTVDVFALRRSADFSEKDTIRGVSVHRIQSRLEKTRRSKIAYVWQLSRFLLSSSWKITRNHMRQPYDVLHIHNMPDLLVFAAWYPRLTGARVILDIHDIVPELYSSKFAAGEKAVTVSLLKWLERRSARFAQHVIISNHLWLDTFANRTGLQGRCSVFINNVDTRVFQPVVRTREDGKILILFPGGLQWHQGLDIAIDAFQRVSREFPNAEFHIYGDGNMKPSLIAQADAFGFGEKVRFFAPLRIAEIARVMANADLGVVPKRADSFGNEAYSTKIMEFMSVGVPVVVSKTKIDQYYFDDTVVRFFKSGDADDLAEAMIETLRSSEARKIRVSNALKYSVKNSWDSRKGDYLKLVDSLSEPRQPRYDAS